MTALRSAPDMPARAGLAALVLAGAVAALAACAPALTPAQCMSNDWRAIGLADGMQGRGGAAFTSYVEACGKLGVAPDRSAWLAGRREGLGVYCAPPTAYDRGRSGLSFPAVCTETGPPSPQMEAAWAFGRRYWDLGLEIERLRRDYRADARDGALLPSEVALAPAELNRLRYERARHAYWPPR